jgi:serine/threonine protein kinase
MPNLTGQMLGKVRVDMFLARGGMADVFIGTHTTLHRAVAIKFLKGDLQDDPELRQRFEREARVIALLRHPNIVQVYDFDKFENQPYLVMEYVPGASLGAFLKELHKNNQRLDILQVNKLLSKLASALKYAHDNDVIHRDIKPANILLTSRTNPVAAGQPLPEDTEPIITDFGLVRFTQSSRQTSTGVITGTPAYMSPEQARGDHVDARTDVYSLGVTVYEMLAGRVPFDSDSTLGLLHRQIYDPPPPIQGISQDLQTVMNRAMAKNAEERFKTPVEFAEAFEAALFGTSEAATLNMPGSVSLSHKTITKPQRTDHRAIK